MYKKLIPLLAILFLSGCTTSHYTAPSPRDPAEAKIAQAAASVSNSLRELEATQQAATPPAKVNNMPAPSSYGMAAKASIDWSGPIEPLVSQIAADSHYKLQVLGSAPAVPIIITISQQNVSIANILRNVGYQAGTYAETVVFPSTRIIQLRYKSWNYEQSC